MARAAKKSARRNLALVSNNGRSVKTNARSSTRLTEINSETEAQLEYQSNKRKFFKLLPRTENQAIYIDNLHKNRLNFALGVAGTGKTFISTMFACDLLEKQEIERIVVTRPMVGCDEDMGFLPGTEAEKYEGWVGPVTEILEGRLGKKQVESFIKYGKIVLKPLMQMRGSTFRDAFVILDEAQNTTPGQMKMFLTRLGEGSKITICGDLEQTDLPAHKGNGLKDAYDRLKNSDIIGQVTFVESDVVRDPLLREILKAYRT